MHRNPLSMMLPPPAPLSGSLLAEFRGETRRALGKIREVENIVFQGEEEPQLAAVPARQGGRPMTIPTQQAARGKRG